MLIRREAVLEQSYFIFLISIILNLVMAFPNGTRITLPKMRQAESMLHDCASKGYP